MNEKVKQALDLLEDLRKATLDTDIDSMGGLVVTNESCFENEINKLKDIVNDFDRYYESQQDLIKGKDEYIAKLVDENKKSKENFVKMVTAKDKLNAEINNEKEELKEHEKELIAEQNRLFDLAKEQENELKELKKENRSLTKTIAQLTEADYYFITSMALDMLKSNSNFALMYVDNIFCLVDTKDNNFDVIDNYDIDTENIGKSKYQKLEELKEFVKVLCKMKIVDSNHKIYGINENDIELIKKVVEKYGNYDR